MSLPRGGQLKISGGVVNVPADGYSTITCLPRSLNESYTVPIKVKETSWPILAKYFQGIVMYKQ